MIKKSAQFYDYLVSKNITVPDTYEEFETTMQDSDVSSGLYDFVKSKGIEVPETIEAFQSDFRVEESPEVKKKEPTDPPVVEETEEVTVSESPIQDGDSVSVELDEKEEAEFQKWMTTDPNVKAWREEFISEYGEEPKIEGANYDYRGAWKAGLKPEPTYEPETKKTLHHWGSKGLEGIDLKSQDHPTRWKSDYMEAFGVNPDESGIGKEDALLELSKPKEPKSDPETVDTDPPTDPLKQAISFATYQFEQRQNKNTDRFDYYTEVSEDGKTQYFKKENPVYLEEKTKKEESQKEANIAFAEKYGVDPELIIGHPKSQRDKNQKEIGFEVADKDLLSLLDDPEELGLAEEPDYDPPYKLSIKPITSQLSKVVDSKPYMVDRLDGKGPQLLTEEEYAEEKKKFESIDKAKSLIKDDIYRMVNITDAVFASDENYSRILSRTNILGNEVDVNSPFKGIPLAQGTIEDEEKMFNDIWNSDLLDKESLNMSESAAEEAFSRIYQKKIERADDLARQEAAQNARNLMIASGVSQNEADQALVKEYAKSDVKTFSDKENQLYDARNNTANAISNVKNIAKDASEELKGVVFKALEEAQQQEDALRKDYKFEYITDPETGERLDVSFSDDVRRSMNVIEAILDGDKSADQRLKEYYIDYSARYNELSDPKKNTTTISIKKSAKNPYAQAALQTLAKSGYNPVSLEDREEKKGDVLFENVPLSFISKNSFLYDAADDNAKRAVDRWGVEHAKSLSDKEAAARLHLLNLNPSDLEVSKLQEFGKGFVAGFVGEESARKVMGATERQKIDEMINVLMEQGEPVTDEQLDKLERTFTEGLASGAGDFTAIGLKLLALNKVAGVTRIGELLSTVVSSLNKGTKAQKALAFTLGAAYEEIQMQTAGMDPMVGATFFASGKGLTAIGLTNLFKLRGRAARLNIPANKLFESGVKGTLAAESSHLMIKSGESLLDVAGFRDGGKTFKNFMKETYGDLDVVNERLLTNAILFPMFAAKDILRPTNFSRSMQIKEAQKLREAGYPAEAAMYEANINLAYKITETQSKLVEAQIKDVKDNLSNLRSDPEMSSDFHKARKSELENQLKFLTENLESLSSEGSASGLIINRPDGTKVFRSYSEFMEVAKERGGVLEVLDSINKEGGSIEPVINSKTASNKDAVEFSDAVTEASKKEIKEEPKEEVDEVKEAIETVKRDKNLTLSAKQWADLVKSNYPKTKSLNKDSKEVQDVKKKIEEDGYKEYSGENQARGKINQKGEISITDGNHRIIALSLINPAKKITLPMSFVDGVIKVKNRAGEFKIPVTNLSRILKQAKKPEVKEEVDKVEAAKAEFKKRLDEWKKDNQNLGLQFDFKSKADKDMELLESAVKYAYEVGARKYADIVANVKEYFKTEGIKVVGGIDKDAKERIKSKIHSKVDSEGFLLVGQAKLMREDVLNKLEKEFDALGKTEKGYVREYIKELSDGKVTKTALKEAREKLDATLEGNKDLSKEAKSAVKKYAEAISKNPKSPTLDVVKKGEEVGKKQEKIESLKETIKTLKEGSKEQRAAAKEKLAEQKEILVGKIKKQKEGIKDAKNTAKVVEDIIFKELKELDITEMTRGGVRNILSSVKNLKGEAGDAVIAKAIDKVVKMAMGRTKESVKKDLAKVSKRIKAADFGTSTSDAISMLTIDLSNVPKEVLAKYAEVIRDLADSNVPVTRSLTQLSEFRVNYSRDIISHVEKKLSYAEDLIDIQAEREIELGQAKLELDAIKNSKKKLRGKEAKKREELIKAKEKAIRDLEKSIDVKSFIESIESVDGAINEVDRAWIENNYDEIRKAKNDIQKSSKDPKTREEFIKATENKLKDAVENFKDVIYSTKEEVAPEERVVEEKAKDSMITRAARRINSALFDRYKDPSVEDLIKENVDMDYTLDKFSEMMKKRHQNSIEYWEKKGDSDMVEWNAEKLSELESNPKKHLEKDVLDDRIELEKAVKDKNKFDAEFYIKEIIHGEIALTGGISSKTISELQAKLDQARKPDLSEAKINDKEWSGNLSPEAFKRLVERDDIQKFTANVLNNIKVSDILNYLTVSQARKLPRIIEDAEAGTLNGEGHDIAVAIHEPKGVDNVISLGPEFSKRFVKDGVEVTNAIANFVEKTLEGPTLNLDFADKAKKVILTNIDAVSKGLKGSPIYTQYIGPYVNAKESVNTKASENAAKATSLLREMKGDAVFNNTLLSTYALIRQYDLAEKDANGNPVDKTVADPIKSINKKLQDDSSSLFSSQRKAIEELKKVYESGGKEAIRKMVKNRGGDPLIELSDKAFQGIAAQSKATSEIILKVPHSTIEAYSPQVTTKSAKEVPLDGGNRLTLGYKAGSLNQRTAKVSELTFDFLNDFTNTYRDQLYTYEVGPEIKRVNKAVSYANKVGNPNVRTLYNGLKEVLLEDARSTVQNSSLQESTTGRAYAKATDNLKTTKLSGLGKMGAEAIATLAKSVIFNESRPALLEGMAVIVKNAGKKGTLTDRLRITHDVLETLGSSHAARSKALLDQRYNQIKGLSDIRLKRDLTAKEVAERKVFGNMPLSTVQKNIGVAASLPIKIGDVTIVAPLTVGSIYLEFKKLTGENFDFQKYKSDPVYNAKYKEAVRRSVAKADKTSTRVAGIGTPGVRPLSQRQRGYTQDFQNLFRSFSQGEAESYDDVKAQIMNKGGTFNSKQDAASFITAQLFSQAVYFASRQYFITEAINQAGRVMYDLSEEEEKKLDWTLSEGISGRIIADMVVTNLLGKYGTAEKLIAATVINGGLIATDLSKEGPAYGLDISRQAYLPSFLAKIGTGGMALGTILQTSFDVYDGWMKDPNAKWLQKFGNSINEFGLRGAVNLASVVTKIPAGQEVGAEASLRKKTIDNRAQLNDLFVRELEYNLTKRQQEISDIQDAVGAKLKPIALDKTWRSGGKTYKVTELGEIELNKFLLRDAKVMYEEKLSSNDLVFGNDNEKNWELIKAQKSKLFKSEKFKKAENIAWDKIRAQEGKDGVFQGTYVTIEN